MQEFGHLIPLFFLTAALYSMVGFAGGSTYLALMALSAYPYELMPITSLICNILVSAGGVFLFFRAGHLRLKILAPFLLTALPAAYLGGTIPLRRETFLILLGLLLMIAALRLMLSEAKFGREKASAGPKLWAVGLPLGAVLGLVSGLSGIGGGILLAPVLYFLGWGNAKQVAAASSAFILLNSLSGLAGQMQKGAYHPDTGLIFSLAAAVVLGGQIGSRLGAHRFSKILVQRLTGILLLSVSLKVLWEAWHA